MTNFKCSDFLEEWLRYGSEEKVKEPYRFISYYIAFNFLYNGEERFRDKKPSTHMDSEINQIYNFIDSYRSMEILNEIDIFDKLGKKSEYHKRNVRSEKTNVRAIAKEIEEKNIYELFLAIYIVRCNLFHGSKSLIGENGDRNRNLIEEGSEVLKELLEKCKDYYKTKGL